VRNDTIVRHAQGKDVPGWASMLTVLSFRFGIHFIPVGILQACGGSFFQMVQHGPQLLIEQMTPQSR
jgi:hypothetical protein